MEKIAAKYEGAVDVVKVDVDANPRISQAFNIMSIPTIAFFRPGQQPLGVAGARPMEALEAQFGLAQYATDDRRGSPDRGLIRAAGRPRRTDHRTEAVRPGRLRRFRADQ